MEIGRLNQRITILENRTVVDEIGNHISKWDEAFSCWAEAFIPNTVTASSESTESGVTKETQTMQFLIRQNSYTINLSTTLHRILFRGIEYNITGIKPSFSSKDYMKIIAIVRKMGACDE